nr:zinc finger protein OZF-like [Nothobranchius furzeri]
MLVKKEVPEDQSTVMDQQDPESLHIKEEHKELWTSLEGEHLHWKEETDVARFPVTAFSIKSEDDEEKPLVSQLHQQQIEDRDVPTSSSADQMAAETGGGAGTSRNPDLNPHEQTSDSSETEVSEEDDDDEVNLDSGLLDSWAETKNKDEDNQWNENRTSDSDIKTVNKSFSCPECGKKFLHKCFLQKHVRVMRHFAISSSSCLVNKKCVRVKRHKDLCRRVQKEPESFSCNDCGIRFGKKSDLNSHTGQKPFSCDRCRSFSQKTCLNSHMKVHTGLKPFPCELCGQRFSQKANLNTHLRVHTGQKPFPCELCGQRFSQKSHLNNHMSVHTGKKTFCCQMCGRVFSRKSHLNNHMSIHTGLKTFPCELCGQRFGQKTTLNRHMRVHTGQKPFPCEFCGQIFSRKENLNSHTRVHTGQKPFPCEVCGQRFSQKSHLNRHMSVHTE